MSRFMLNWFRGLVGLSDEERDFQTTVLELEDAAEHADWRTRAKLFNRAGDLCAARESERALALAYYGRSIDAHLEARNFGAAAAMCRKLLRFAPRAVRAHCTLAFLCVRDHHIGDPQPEIEAYVTAARATRTERFAIPRLRMLADVAEDPQLRRVIALALFRLRDEEGGHRILDALAPGAPPQALDEAARWDRLLKAAVMDSHELWERAWINFNTYHGEVSAIADLHDGSGREAAAPPVDAAATTG